MDSDQLIAQRDAEIDALRDQLDSERKSRAAAQAEVNRLRGINSDLTHQLQFAMREMGIHAKAKP